MEATAAATTVDRVATGRRSAAAEVLDRYWRRNSLFDPLDIILSSTLVNDTMLIHARYFKNSPVRFFFFSRDQGEFLYVSC